MMGGWSTLCCGWGGRGKREMGLFGFKKKWLNGNHTAAYNYLMFPRGPF